MLGFILYISDKRKTEDSKGNQIQPESYKERAYSKNRARYRNIFRVLMCSEEFSKRIRKEWVPRTENIDIYKEEFMKGFKENRELRDPGLILSIIFFLRYYDMIFSKPVKGKHNLSYNGIIEKKTKVSNIENLENQDGGWVYRKMELIYLERNLEARRKAISSLSSSFYDNNFLKKSKEWMSPTVFNDYKSFINKFQPEYKADNINKNTAVFEKIISEALYPGVMPEEVKKIIKEATDIEKRLKNKKRSLEKQIKELESGIDSAHNLSTENADKLKCLIEQIDS